MAASLVISFLAFAVVGRVLIQFHFTGNHGIRVADATTQPLAALAGSAFVLSFTICIVIIGLDTLNLWSLRLWQASTTTLPGAVIGYTGIAVVVIAQWQMQSSWRIGVDPDEITALITTGLYARSRNPIYFGIFLFWLGLSLVIPNPVIWALAMICWGSIEAIVRRVEEPYLQALHGETFTRYRQQTSRYVPW